MTANSFLLWHDDFLEVVFACMNEIKFDFEELDRISHECFSHIFMFSYLAGLEKRIIS